METVHLIDREDCDDENYPDRTLIWSNEGDNYNFSPDDEIIKGSRVSYKELKKYIGYGFNTFYGWHITDLKIYDKPKELSEFIRVCPEWEKEKVTSKCRSCDHYYESRAECLTGCDIEGEIPITKAPQSWGYAEGE